MAAAKKPAAKKRARKPAASTPPASTSPSSSALPAAEPTPLTQVDAPATPPTDNLPAPTVGDPPANLDAILGDRAQEREALEQGFAGTKVDPLPNEAHSLESGPDAPLASEALGNTGQENR